MTDLDVKINNNKINNNKKIILLLHHFISLFLGVNCKCKCGGNVHSYKNERETGVTVSLRRTLKEAKEVRRA